VDDETLRRKLIIPNSERIHYIHAAFERGWTIEELNELTGIDPWFLTQLRQVVDMQEAIKEEDLASLSAEQIRSAKRMGFSDARLADLLKTTEDEVRAKRLAAGVRPVYKRVDTCGAEFESHTPYLYSTYETECEAAPTDRRKIMILGSGPNRIGQGIEFDYCCCHAAFALKEDGYETIMVNCNPETVSTDYDTSDRLYFEPLTFEDVMHIVELEKPEGVIVQFGGQTPLNLAMRLHKAGVPIIGTSPESIDLAEDRKRFGKLIADLNIPQPVNGTAVTVEEAKRVAAGIGYPVLVRPSYVLGGRAMMIVYDETSLDLYMKNAVEASPEKPILIDRFLEDAFEVDVDALSDGERCVIAGIQEHIEEAGIHSGDSSCVLPPYMVKPEHLDTMRKYTRQLAQALDVRGLMNIQFAIKDDIVYVLEVNPRASRTVPFVSKATGVPLAKIASRVMTGRKLSEFNLPDELTVSSFFIKEPVFPFVKFPGVDPVLGPEMRSTGEVMGVGDSFGAAFAKAQMGANATLPTTGTAFISVNDNDKKNAVRIAKRLHELGFKIVATRGTAGFLSDAGVPAERVYKVNEGRPNVVDLIKSDEIDLIVNTPLGRASFYDERAIRRAAMQYNVVTFTTLTGANAAASAIASMKKDGKLSVISLQEHHA
ncbi:MAG: carbamoyl-phosphate synthase large subunit, partial [Acidobacteria bacterium]|nr:carbamoyl-phosphate synthase large subunit [Acidobacteriota bacterium]